MALPIIMIFEQHLDPTPQLLLKNLLPEIANEGYNTVCQEIPSTQSEQQALDWTKNNVKNGIEYMQLFNQIANKTKLDANRNLCDCTVELLDEAIPSHYNFSTSERKNFVKEVKGFTSRKLRYDNLQFAKKKAFSIECIDDKESSDYIDLHINDMKAYGDALSKTHAKRDQVLADHLFDLHAKNKALLAQIGAAHMRGVIDRLKTRGLDDENMVICFPHSIYPPYRDKDLIQSIVTSGEVLVNKKVCATTNNEISLLGQKLLKEIKFKNLKNCHTEFLHKHFNVHFRPSLKDQYYLDALLPFDDEKDIAHIQKALKDKGITNRTTLKGTQYHLVIPNVNTTKVGHSIRSLEIKV